jgi:hypothetical protein
MVAKLVEVVSQVMLVTCTSTLFFFQDIFEIGEVDDTLRLTGKQLFKAVRLAGHCAFSFCENNKLNIAQQEPNIFLISGGNALKISLSHLK